MDTIRFANGAVYDCTFLATLPDGSSFTAFIALADVDFAEAARIFSDPDMTAEMEYGEYLLVGYTDLAGLYQQPYGVQAVLKGGHDERLDS